jgi:hypothetical protein
MLWMNVRRASFTAIFVFLTSIRSRDYLLYEMGDIDSAYSGN